MSLLVVYTVPNNELYILLSTRYVPWPLKKYIKFFNYFIYPYSAVIRSPGTTMFNKS